jgi:hypothetical protein
VLFVTAFMAVLASTAVAQLTKGIDGARSRAAARYMAQQCGLARIRAVVGLRSVALRFTPRGDDYDIETFVDGNGNGVRTVDIARGIDTRSGAAIRIRDQFPGVRLGVGPGLDGDALRLGGTMLLSFSPVGTSTSGSIFIVGRDHSQFRVRILGATARTRLQRYVPERNEWMDL